MRVIENLVRRILFTFSIATFVTIAFNHEATSIKDLASITWLVFAILFILSWRLVREIKEIFIKEVEEDESMWGQFEKRYPRFAAIVWQCFATLAAIHIFYLSMDAIGIIEVNGQRTKLFLYALFVTIVFRLIDQHTYRKK